MVRAQGSAVLGAVREQIEYLKRTSRQNAWGIKVAFEEPATGFAQSEDIVVSLFVPYCESGAEWEVVIDADAPQRCPDLVPLPATEADVTKGFTQGMHETYIVYRLNSLDSLKKWDLFQRPSSLAALALDIKRLRREHEIQKLANSPLSSAAKFHLEFLRDRQDDIEILVSRAGVRMAFPLLPDPAAAAAVAAQAAAGIGGGAAGGGVEAAGAEGGAGAGRLELEGPLFVYGRAGIRLRMEWTQVDGNRPDVRVVFSHEAQGLTRGFRQPPWSTDTVLSDYLPKAQLAVVRPWSERKKLVAVFAARYSVLEYDAQDFTKVHLFMKVRLENLIHLRMLRVDIGPDFPEFPPQLTLCDSLSDKSWTLDRRDYLYSPRWDAERMATELYAHAVEALSKFRD